MSIRSSDPQADGPSTPPSLSHEPRTLLDSRGRPPKFEVLTSLRYDPLLLSSPLNTALSSDPTSPTGFYMLSYHHARLLAAVSDLGWNRPIELLEGVTNPDEGLPWLTRILTTSVEQCQKSSGTTGPLKVRLPAIPLSLQKELSNAV